jgi:ribonuclease R
VQHVLETGQLTQVRYPEFSQDLELMSDLAGRLARRRSRLGAIDFNLPETKIQLDEHGEPVAISPDPQSFANKIIEVFMVAANETVARLAARHRLPFLYRVHDEPDPVKIKDLLRLSRVLGLKDIRKKKPSVADLSGLLAQSAAQPFAPVFAQQLLRAMARAEYRAQNDGHYGLASACYCHFTSPIRRYPDLVVHRIIKAHLRHRLDVATWRRTVTPLAVWCSCCERTAQKAEWASRDLKVAEYYVKRLGDLDEGIIAGFSPAGLIVRLSNSVEGMIPYRDLPQYVTFIPERLEAVSSTGQVLYRAGDRVKIQIARADIVLRRLDFALVTNRHQAGRQKANLPPQQAKDGKRRGRRRAADRR